MNNSNEFSFQVSVPDLIANKIHFSRLYQNYSKTGKPTSYGMDIDFTEMNLSKAFKSSKPPT